MDPFRFKLCNLLQDAKNFYNLQHGPDPAKSLLSISVDTGISTSDLSLIFNGRKIPSVLQFLKICASLECRVDVFPVDTYKAFPQLKYPEQNVQSERK